MDAADIQCETEGVVGDEVVAITLPKLLAGELHSEITLRGAEFGVNLENWGLQNSRFNPFKAATR